MGIEYVEIRGDLRDQDGIGFSGDASAKRRVAGVASEHFHDHDAIMGAGCGLKVFEKSSDTVNR